ncbi:MAG: N-acetylmuramoyl-L-alanine amidase [Lachnospiraceae bacterium]|nr:N-acetylmuramoyl-L-alanine amidase [Lachnospiraceae bacterium]
MKKHELLIITIIAAVICMPVMLFLFMHNDVYAGNMLMEDSVYDEEEEAVKLSLEIESNMQVVEGMDEGIEASLAIPLEYNIEMDKINVEEDKAASFIEITIPVRENNYYYKNELTGSQKGIADISYNYSDGYAEFDIKMDGFYISVLHLTPKYLYLELNTPYELYGHTFIIDAAHGGDDIGDSAYGVREKDVSLGIAKAIEGFANADGTGGIYYTRSQDENVSEESRAKLIALLKPDYVISVHTNADGNTRITNGIGAVVNNPDDVAEVKKLVNVIASETGQQDLGVRIDTDEENPEAHTINLYMGYITNKAEALQMNTEEYISKAGNVIYAWLLHEEKNNR